MLTLRQIEVVRAVMISGSIAGAARLLNVSQPGLSRTMKHVEAQLKIKLFVRQGGRFAPSPEAREVFTQLQAVNRKVEDLNFAIDQLSRGDDVELRVAAVPSIGSVAAPRAIAKLRKRFPALRVNFEILKIEEAIDYLLLGKGEAVAVSQRYSHPSIAFKPLARGKLVCIVAPNHALAARAHVAAADMAAFPLIGVDPNDPYGRIMVDLFERAGLSYDIAIRARFGATVCALVKENVGIALIDAFTVADVGPRELKVIPIAEPTAFETFIAHRADMSLSSFAEAFIAATRAQMIAVMNAAPA